MVTGIKTDSKLNGMEKTIQKKKTTHQCVVPSIFLCLFQPLLSHQHSPSKRQSYGPILF